MKKISSESIATYLPLCNRLARKFTGVGKAEYEDLRQEGMIAIWLALGHGFLPTTQFVERRMRNWTNKCRRSGMTGHEKEES